MDDNYGSEDNYGNEAVEDNVEEVYSDDLERSVEYNDEPQLEQDEHSDIGSEQDEEEGIPLELESQQDNYQIIQEVTKDEPNQKRITSTFMTKFQKARVIGVRAAQISKNSPLYLKNQSVINMNWDPITIAEKQLAQKRIPFIIRRYLPDGSFQDWKLSQLKTFD